MGQWEEEYDPGLSYEQWPIPRIFKSKESTCIFAIQSMTYKSGDLLMAFDHRHNLVDLGVIEIVTAWYVKYRWLGFGNNGEYEFNMRVESFDHALEIGDYQVHSCDSESEREANRLIILLKYADKIKE